MGLIISPGGKGKTPLDENESQGLLIQSVTTQEELNEFEQQNIEKAIQWSISKRHNPQKILTEEFVKKVHEKMYGEVWAWAGNFRKTNKNLGIPWAQIPVALKQLLDDANYQVTNNAFTPDEMAIRFKHRIVQIHCFPNGNGRHSRLMADIIISHVFKSEIFTWGGEHTSVGSQRSEYLKALKLADAGDIKALLKFSRN
jgi:Fic-DOC domain mobile mystery protein B